MLKGRFRSREAVGGMRGKFTYSCATSMLISDVRPHISGQVGKLPTTMSRFHRTLGLNMTLAFLVIFHSLHRGLLP